jgi:coenzyme F420-reducing hydrogenase delta subunit
MRYSSWLRHYATSRKVAGSIPHEVIGFIFNGPNPSSRTMALGSTQSLTEMSTSNLPGGNGRPARKADNLTVICETIMWEPRRITALWTSTACYRDSFTLPNPSSRTMALGSTQPLTEMSTSNLPGGNGRPARKADNLTVICETIMWEPRRITALWASTSC